MPAWNIIQAVNDALRLEMRRDPRVVVMGEDVGKFGGVFRATVGLIEEFGADRVIDTPLAEAGIIGAAMGEVPEGEYTVPIGQARVAREGRGLTVIAWGAMFHEALQAVEQSPELDAELIDLRTLWPLDIGTVTQSVRKTGRCAIVQEAPRTNGFAAEISALVQERCFTSLEAPIARITGWDTPFPYTLENEYLPLAPRIQRTLRELKAYEA